MCHLQGHVSGYENLNTSFLRWNQMNFCINFFCSKLIRLSALLKILQLTSVFRVYGFGGTHPYDKVPDSNPVNSSRVIQRTAISRLCGQSKRTFARNGHPHENLPRLPLLPLKLSTFYPLALTSSVWASPSPSQMPIETLNLSCFLRVVRIGLGFG